MRCRTPSWKSPGHPNKSQEERVNAQMTLSVGGYTLRGQDAGANVFAAVDGVTDIIDRQIRRFKTKVYGPGQV
ncbi:MAG TPA: HPF/RaiA family ribosome-associated protein [Dehalococcoidia bacterium]|nr:HPF/RaiA family ribosome-associated protein [Dehalococcoidia bacterium]